MAAFERLNGVYCSRRTAAYRASEFAKDRWCRGGCAIWKGCFVVRFGKLVPQNLVIFCELYYINVLWKKAKRYFINLAL